MIKVESGVYFIRSRHDEKSIRYVLNELKDNGFGYLYSHHNHNVALCSDEFAERFNNYTDDSMQMSKYELHPKRLPPEGSNNTLVVRIPKELSSIQAKSQLKDMIGKLSRYIDVHPDNVDIRIRVNNGVHKGLAFITFKEVQPHVIALINMFLRCFHFEGVNGFRVKTRWYEKSHKKEKE